MFSFSRQKNIVNIKLYFSIISMYLIIYLQVRINNMYVRIHYSKNKKYSNFLKKLFNNKIIKSNFLKYTKLDTRFQKYNQSKIH